jgi:hypothetical protein
MFFFCSSKVKPASRQPDRGRCKVKDRRRWLFLPASSDLTARGAGRGVSAAVPGRRSADRPRGLAQCGSDISLHHSSGRAHQTEATDMMVQMHWFGDRRPIVTSMIGFVVVATLLCLLLGPIGIVYALGFEVLYLLTYLLTIAFAALLDSDEY